MWYRILHKEIALIIILILSIFTAIICEYGSKTWILYQFETVLDLIQSGKNIFSALSIGFITGVIIYIVSVVFPEVRRSVSLCIEIDQTFKKIEDSFIEFGLQLQLGNWDNRETFVDNFIKILHETKQAHEDFLILSPIGKPIEQLSKSLNKNSMHLLDFQSIFDTKELEFIMKLRHHSTTKVLACDEDLLNLRNESEIKTYVEDIMDLREDYKKIHVEFNNKRFKI